jgi:hypothetical protein
MAATAISMDVDMNQEQQLAYEKVIALREYTKSTRQFTHKAQYQILNALRPEDMGDVVLALKKHEQEHGW